MAEQSGIAGIRADSWRLIATIRYPAAFLAGVAVAGFLAWYAMAPKTAPGPRESSLPGSNVVDVHRLGQAVGVGNFIITAGAERRSVVGTAPAQISSPRGMIYVAVRYDVTNASGGSVTTLALPRVELVDAFAAHYRPDSFLSAAFAHEVQGDTSFRRSLGPSETSHEVAVFEVNESAFDPANWQLLFRENNRDVYVSLGQMGRESVASAAPPTPSERPSESDEQSPPPPALSEQGAEEAALAEQHVRAAELARQEQAKKMQAQAEELARAAQARAEELARLERARAQEQARLEQAQREERAREAQLAQDQARLEQAQREERAREAERAQEQARLEQSQREERAREAQRAQEEQARLAKAREDLQREQAGHRLSRQEERRNDATPTQREARAPAISESDDRPESTSGSAVVEGFYAALGRGNGAAASQYVVPEKAGNGPLSAKSMTKFFSSLRSHLVTQQILRLPGNRYRVDYSYGHGARAVCNGRAIVSVTERNGRPLIQRIQALSGC